MIEDKLEKCLRFSSEHWSQDESEMEILARKAIAELRKLRKKTTGWSGYGWKDGEYIGDIQEFFDSHED
jgi:hypothetical protein